VKNLSKGGDFYLAIQNRQLMEMSISKDIQTTITINSSTNNKGKLEVNDNGRTIKNNIDGSRVINKIDILNSTGILLYNENEWTLFKNNIDLENNIGFNGIIGKPLLLRDNIDINYKINANLYRNLNFNTNELTISEYNALTHTIYKVFLNGKETTNYTTSTDKINFTLLSIYTNYCEIIYYPNNQTLNTESYAIRYLGQVMI